MNATAPAQLQYQGINEQCMFDTINLTSYDLILSTPWMYQHQLCLGFNLPCVIIGSDDVLPVTEGMDTRFMLSSLSTGDQAIENAQNDLHCYAEPLCQEVDKIDL